MNTNTTNNTTTTAREYIIENLSKMPLTEWLSSEQRIFAESTGTNLNEVARNNIFNYFRKHLPEDAKFRQFTSYLKMIRYNEKLPYDTPIEKCVDRLRIFLYRRHKYNSIMLIDETTDYQGNFTSNDEYDIVEKMSDESLVIMVHTEPIYKVTRIFDGAYRTYRKFIKNEYSFRVLSRAEYLKEHGFEVYESLHYFDKSTPTKFVRNQLYMESLSDSNFDFEVPRMFHESTIDDYSVIHRKVKSGAEFVDGSFSNIGQEAYVSKTSWTKEAYIAQANLLKAYVDFIALHPEIADLFDDIDTGICPECGQKTRVKYQCTCRHCSHEFTIADLAEMNIDGCQAVSYNAYRPEWLEDEEE